MKMHTIKMSDFTSDSARDNLYEILKDTADIVIDYDPMGGKFAVYVNKFADEDLTRMLRRYILTATEILELFNVNNAIEFEKDKGKFVRFGFIEKTIRGVSVDY